MISTTDAAPKNVAASSTNCLSTMQPAGDVYAKTKIRISHRILAKWSKCDRPTDTCFCF